VSCFRFLGGKGWPIFDPLEWPNERGPRDCGPRSPLWRRGQRRGGRWRVAGRIRRGEISAVRKRLRQEHACQRYHGLLPPFANGSGGVASWTRSGRVSDAELRSMRGPSKRRCSYRTRRQSRSTWYGGDQMQEALRAHRLGPGPKARALALRTEVGIADPARRYHDSRSGCRAACASQCHRPPLSPTPTLLIADEPTTALASRCRRGLQR